MMEDGQIIEKSIFTDKLIDTIRDAFSILRDENKKCMRELKSLKDSNDKLHKEIKDFISCVPVAGDITFEHAPADTSEINGND